MICTFYTKFNNQIEWTEFKHSKLEPIISWYSQNAITAFLFAIDNGGLEVVVHYEDKTLNGDIVKRLINIGLTSLPRNQDLQGWEEIINEVKAK